MISQLPPAVLVHACAHKHVYINMMHSSRRVSEPCSQDSVCVNSESLLLQDIPTLRAPHVIQWEGEMEIIAVLYMRGSLKYDCMGLRCFLACCVCRHVCGVCMCLSLSGKRRTRQSSFCSVMASQIMGLK